MPLVITNEQHGVRGNKRFYTAQFQFTGGDSVGAIVPTVTQVSYANASYDVAGQTIDASLEMSATPGLPDGAQTLTAAADSSGYINIEGL